MDAKVNILKILKIKFLLNDFWNLNKNGVQGISETLILILSVLFSSMFIFATTIFNHRGKITFCRTKQIN